MIQQKEFGQWKSEKLEGLQLDYIFLLSFIICFTLLSKKIFSKAAQIVVRSAYGRYFLQTNNHLQVSFCSEINFKSCALLFLASLIIPKAEFELINLSNC